MGAGNNTTTFFGRLLCGLLDDAWRRRALSIAVWLHCRVRESIVGWVHTDQSFEVGTETLQGCVAKLGGNSIQFVVRVGHPIAVLLLGEYVLPQTPEGLAAFCEQPLNGARRDGEACGNICEGRVVRR